MPMTGLTDGNRDHEIAIRTVPFQPNQWQQKDTQCHEEVVPKKECIPGSFRLKKGKKWKRYWGLFTLLKQKWSLSAGEWQVIASTALTSFIAMVHLLVPTHVRTSD